MNSPKSRHAQDCASEFLFARIIYTQMSVDIADVFAQGCPNDVYEAKSEQEWIECKRKRNFIGTIIATIIVIIIAIILLIVGGTWTRVITAIIAVVAIVAIVLTHTMWIPAAARTEYAIFKRDLDARLASGQSLKEATESIRNERFMRSMMTPQLAPGSRYGLTPLAVTLGRNLGKT